jgi:hypothetical protein
MPSIEAGDVRSDAHNVRDHFQRKRTLGPYLQRVECPIRFNTLVGKRAGGLGVICPSSRLFV